jgi:two-component system nitrogen regulation response regulator GlnG
MNSNAQVWIAEDDRSLRWVMEKAITKDGNKVRSFENGDALLAALGSAKPDIIVSDIRMPGIDGLDLLKELHSRYPTIPVIITTAHSDLDSAVAAYQGGAFEYLPKPFDLDELVDVSQRAVSFSLELRSSSEPTLPVPIQQEIIGEAPAMQEVFRAIGRLSNSNITVLINGESGTGKELVAQALHKHSPRKSAKFIALNMAAIPRVGVVWT